MNPSAPHATVLFCAPAYQPLLERMSALLPSAPVGKLEYRSFPDGERYLRILTNVREQDVVLLCGTGTDRDTLDLFDLACGFVKEGARSLTVLLPFFGYGTMERQVKSGEVVVAKARARLISAVPCAPSGNRIALLDLHADGITYYFEGALTPQHVYAKAVVLPAIRQLGGDVFALGSVDAGRAKWVESLANELHVPASFILKRRVSGTQTEVLALSSAVTGRRVVIYDDMVRTGGSLLGAARAYLDAGATDVTAVATHGLFPGDALERIRASGLIKNLCVTDSHPAMMSRPADDGFLRVVSVAPVLADHVKSLGL